MAWLVEYIRDWGTIWAQCLKSFVSRLSSLAIYYIRIIQNRFFGMMEDQDCLALSKSLLGCVPFFWTEVRRDGILTFTFNVESAIAVKWAVACRRTIDYWVDFENSSLKRSQTLHLYHMIAFAICLYICKVPSFVLIWFFCTSACLKALAEYNMSTVGLRKLETMILWLSSTRTWVLCASLPTDGRFLDGSVEDWMNLLLESEIRWNHHCWEQVVHRFLCIQNRPKADESSPTEAPPTRMRPLLANWKAISGMPMEQETFLSALASDFNMFLPYLEYMVQVPHHGGKGNITTYKQHETIKCFAQDLEVFEGHIGAQGSRNPVDKIHEERVCFHITVWLPQSWGFDCCFCCLLLESFSNCKGIPTNDELRTIPKTSETAASSFAEDSRFRSIERYRGPPNYISWNLYFSKPPSKTRSRCFSESGRVHMNIDCLGVHHRRSEKIELLWLPRVIHLGFQSNSFFWFFNAWLSLSTFNSHCQCGSGKQPPGLPRGGQPNSFPVDSKSQERWCESVFGHIFVPQYGGYASDLSGDGSWVKRQWLLACVGQYVVVWVSFLVAIVAHISTLKCLVPRKPICFSTRRIQQVRLCACIFFWGTFVGYYVFTYVWNI